MMDLISAHYGWTDAQILDLTPRRLRIAVDAIAQRINQETTYQMGLTEWTVKNIVSGFRVMVHPKQSGKFDQWVDRISLISKKKKASAELTEDSFRGRPLPSGDKLLQAFNARR